MDSALFELQEELALPLGDVQLRLDFSFRPLVEPV